MTRIGSIVGSGAQVVTPRRCVLLYLKSVICLVRRFPVCKMILSCKFCNYLPITTIMCLSTILMTAAAPEIKLVNVVFRHGDRTPDNNGLEMYPNDPYMTYSFYPTGLGQLTLNGKRREYDLGQRLRDRYNNFLGSRYIPREVLARSSDYDRTKTSLQLVLAGLYPPDIFQQWNKWLRWQPIPASYVPRVDDNLFLSDECPEYIAEYERVLRSSETRDILSGFDIMRQNLTKLTGKIIETPMDMYFLYHTFKAEASLGLPLPEWAYDYFPDGSLFNGIVISYDISSKNKKLRKYLAGPLIRVMTENMLTTQNDTTPAKIYLYSGHESNIAALLHAFQVYEPHVPEYSSAVILELQLLNSRYYVKLIYYTGIPPVFKELKIPGCDLLCPFEKYLDLITSLIPSRGELICDKRRTPDYATVEYPAAVQNMIYNLIKSSTSKSRNQV